MLLLLSVVAAVAFARSVQETVEEKDRDMTHQLEAMDGTYVAFTLSIEFILPQPYSDRCGIFLSKVYRRRNAPIEAMLF